MKTLLKKSALLMAGLSFISLANATKHVVTVQNFMFSPSSFTATVGDTIEWDWINGGHTTTSTGVPVGAATWSNPMNNTSTTFQYVITTPGTYNYWCAIHTTAMEASFTVTATAVPYVESFTTLASVYPNPASGQINFHMNTCAPTNILTVTDIQGRVVLRKTLIDVDNNVDVSEWTKGIYFYQLNAGTLAMKGKLEVQ
ncbi:MAG TPA: T9SS type A sorting domain-containing protein [Bacteroidia bacterium]|jgi:plastocyanin|nr:T9SS type A sorting domain-containing protein [Bacteroidia bacterium]